MTAEKNANTRIDEVYLAQTGAHLQGVFNVGATSVRSRKKGMVEAADIEHAKEDAKRRDLPDDQAYITIFGTPSASMGRLWKIHWLR